MLQCLVQINDDDVELWVVKAITSKLIDSKMDQMNQVIVVTSNSSPSLHPTGLLYTEGT